MKRLVFLLSLCAFVLFTGCREDLLGPDPAESALETRAPASAFTPDGQKLLVSIKGLSAIDVGGASYTLRVAGILMEGDHAVGEASLADQTDPFRRFHYLFQEGEVRCEQGTAVVHLSGEGFATDNSGAAQGDRLFRHDYKFTVPTSTNGSTPRRRVSGTLLAGEPAELVGETFELEVDRVFVSPNICDT